MAESPLYQITVARSANRELSRLQVRMVERVLPAIEALSTNPRPPGCKKLRGTEACWRIRIGSYRVLYELDDEARIVDVYAIRHRREAYR